MSLRLFISFLILFFFSDCTSDQPKHLSRVDETIEVDYIQWACECARFVETKYLDEGLSGDDLATKCVFIERAKDAKPIPESYYMSRHHDSLLLLIGQYYLDEGISKDYEQQTDVKPNYAKVFRYDSFELVKK